MEREKGRMSEPYLKSSYRRDIWLLCLFLSRPDSRSEMFEKLPAHFFFIGIWSEVYHWSLVKGILLSYTRHCYAYGNNIHECWESKTTIIICRKIPKISPGAYIFQRGLSTEGNLRFKIDWASLIVGSKFTVSVFFYFVFEGNFPSTSPWGAYTRRRLIFGILR